MVICLVLSFLIWGLLIKKSIYLINSMRRIWFNSYLYVLLVRLKHKFMRPILKIINKSTNKSDNSLSNNKSKIYKITMYHRIQILWRGWEVYFTTKIRTRWYKNKINSNIPNNTWICNNIMHRYLSNPASLPLRNKSEMYLIEHWRIEITQKDRYWDKNNFKGRG